jgi:tRNA(Ile)-lysidine synthase TilS/MesJ
MAMRVKLPYARSKTKELLKTLEKENPDLFISLKSAFKHIHKSSFLSKDDLIV